MTNENLYSILQYSEFPESGEFVNVGVALFLDGGSRFLMRFTHSMARIRRVFPDAPSIGEARFMFESFEKRVESEIKYSFERSSLEKFAELRTGKLRMTPPRAILIKDPQASLEQLYHRYIPEGALPRRRGTKVQTKLRKKLEQHQVVQFLDSHPKPIEVFDGVKISAPYAYQNGSYNLICPVSLKNDLAEAVNQAAPLAIKGKQLYDQTRAANQSRLIVVGDWEGPSESDIENVAEIFDEHDVGFYRLDRMDPLVEEIRTSYLKYRKTDFYRY